MKFSELSLAARDMGLTYDEEAVALVGFLNNFGAVVLERGDEYILQIFAEKPHRFEDTIKNEICSLSESMPKNTINRQLCEIDRCEVHLRKSALLQENLALLVAFSETLTEKLGELGLVGKEPLKPEKLPDEKPPAVPKKTERKIKLSFDFGSVKGLLGALIGAAAMMFITYSLVDLTTDSGVGSTFTELGGYILSAAATTLVFFDYRFLAKKLDAFGVIACPIISVVSSLFGSILVTAKAFAALTGTSVLTALASLDSLYEKSAELASAGGGYMAIGVVITVFASLLNCLWYFNKHPDEMTKTEKADVKDKSK